MSKISDLTINMKTEGYEVVKAQLNDIEKQVDRIIEKQKQIKKSCININIENFTNNGKQDINQLVDEMALYNLQNQRLREVKSETGLIGLTIRMGI